MRMLNVGLSRSMCTVCPEKICISDCPGMSSHLPTYPKCSVLPDCLHKEVCSPKESNGGRPRPLLGNGRICLSMRALVQYSAGVVAMGGRKIYVDTMSQCIGLGQEYLLHTYATYNAYEAYTAGHMRSHCEKRERIWGKIEEKGKRKNFDRLVLR